MLLKTFWCKRHCTQHRRSDAAGNSVSVTLKSVSANTAAPTRTRPSRRAAQRKARLLLDSGASDHMVSHKMPLHHLKESDAIIRTADKAPLAGNTSIGTFSLTNGNGDALKLSSVYTNENLRTNLISVSKLVDQPDIASITFDRALFPDAHPRRALALCMHIFIAHLPSIIH